MEQPDFEVIRDLVKATAHQTGNAVARSSALLEARIDTAEARLNRRLGAIEAAVGIPRNRGAVPDNLPV